MQNECSVVQFKNGHESLVVTRQSPLITFESEPRQTGDQRQNAPLIQAGLRADLINR